MSSKLLLTTALLSFILWKANAQTWTTNAGNMYLSSGKLGIGTPTPGFVLTVQNGIVANTIGPLACFGYSGISSNRSIVFEQLGTSQSATQYLFLNGGLDPSSVFGSPKLASLYAPTFGLESNDNNLNIITGLAGSNISPVRAMSFLPGGNVLIGKTTQINSAYILDVNGTARFNEAVVNATGADYVFGGDYQLLSLQAVGDYIKAHHHLPEIAPASQMQQEGVNLGENQTALLRKIEELTLYLLQQNKKLEKQQKRIDKLEKLLKQKGA